MKKIILITGAGTGIGRDAAFALAARGHTVHACTYTEDQARELIADERFPKGTMNVFKMDITQVADREKILTLSPDVLINNAAIGDSGSLAEVDIDRVRKTFEVNVFSTLELTQLALRGMIERERGTIVFISSVAGRIPIPFLMPYSMTKFALSAAGAALRSEMDQLGKGIQVSLIEPGPFHTGFNQSMTSRKYEWMQHKSYFSTQLEKMKAREAKEFKLVEAKATASIVAKIVLASEAARPRLRYVAPWLHGVVVRMARVWGI